MGREIMTGSGSKIVCQRSNVSGLEMDCVVMQS
jgi:hypothetical protein